MTLEEAYEFFTYDPETGELRNRIKRHYRALAGELAGVVHKGHGYIVVKVRQKGYLAHRIVWLMQTGEWPESDIDHKDLDRSNNRWVNLRLALGGGNCQNRAIQCNNTSGVKNVSFDKSRKSNPWIVTIGKDWKRIKRGFPTKEQAVDYANSMRPLIHGEFERS